MRWHSEKAIFDKECSNYPGFVTKFRVSNQFSEANDMVGFENYRHVCHKWHYKITKVRLRVRTLARSLPPSLPPSPSTNSHLCFSPFEFRRLLSVSIRKTTFKLGTL